MNSLISRSARKFTLHIPQRILIIGKSKDMKDPIFQISYKNYYKYSFPINKIFVPLRRIYIMIAINLKLHFCNSQKPSISSLINWTKLALSSFSSTVSYLTFIDSTLYCNQDLKCNNFVLVMYCNKIFSLLPRFQK